MITLCVCGCRVVLITATGWATAIGSGTMYFVQATRDPEVIEPKAPLTFSALKAQRLDIYASRRMIHPFMHACASIMCSSTLFTHSFPFFPCGHAMI
jgi:hypothetical protein